METTEPRVKLKPEIMVQMLRRELKEELRQEILNELQPPQQKPWTFVKDHIDNLLKDYYKTRLWHRYHIQNAIYTIIRFSCGIERVGSLREEQIDQAKEIAENICEMLIPPDLRD